MHTTIMNLVATLRETFLSRASLRLENLDLRQQVAVLKRERRRPSNGLVGDVQASLGEHLFHIAKAQRELGLEPDRMSDDVGGKR